MLVLFGSRATGRIHAIVAGFCRSYDEIRKTTKRWLVLVWGASNSQIFEISSDKTDIVGSIAAHG